MSETIEAIITESRGVFEELRKHGHEVVSVDRMESIIERIEKAYQEDVKHLSELVKAYRAQNAELKSSRDLWFSRADELRVRCDELYAELKKEVAK